MFQKMLIVCMTTLHLLVPGVGTGVESIALCEDEEVAITEENTATAESEEKTTDDAEEATNDSEEVVTTTSVSSDAVVATITSVSEDVVAEPTGIVGGITSMTTGILNTVSDVQSTVEAAQTGVSNRMDIYASLPQKINVVPTVILAIIVLLETAGLVWILLRKLKEEKEPSKEKKAKASARDMSATFTPTTGSHSIKLEVENGSLVNPELSFSFDEQVLIGRASICNIVFNDSDVSKIHARIYFMDGTYYIENLSLKKATYLADMQIQRMNPLDNGDVIQIGSAKFRVRF